jgi:hypothetical protein
MELTITVIVTGFAVLLAAFASWKSGRPAKDSLRAKWISWPLVTIFAGALAILAVVHAVNLMGVHTGQGGAGRPYDP